MSVTEKKEIPASVIKSSPSLKEENESLKTEVANYKQQAFTLAEKLQTLTTQRQKEIDNLHDYLDLREKQFSGIMVAVNQFIDVATLGISLAQAQFNAARQTGSHTKKGEN